MKTVLKLTLIFMTIAVPALGQGNLSIEERLEKLEKTDAELYHTLAGQKEAGLASRIAERITLSGLLEVEAASGRLKYRDADNDAASDLTLATAQLTFGAKVTDSISADLSFLYEEGATDLEVDEAAINFAAGPWKARIGQQYLPFGVFYSHFISDPLILGLGETRDTAVIAGYGNDLFDLSAFAFNGRADQNTGEDHIDDWGASLTFTPVEGLSVGGSYLSDLADSNAELLADEDGNSVWQRRVAGYSAHIIYAIGPVDLSGEYLGAARAFDAGDLDYDADGKGDRPRAWNIEAALDLRENVELALRYEGSREFAEQPERQYGIDLSWAPVERVSLSLEYLRGTFDRDFAPVDGDRIADYRDLVTAQMAVEF
jgi:hypothetical protein